jgi:ComF family protein
MMLDLLYPPVCSLCRAALRLNRWLCADCAQSLPRIAAPFCESCGEPFEGQVEGPFACPNCHDLDFAFHFARPALRNHDSTRRLVHDLKYHRQIQLAAELARLTLDAFADPRLARSLHEKWPLVPVPLHRSRLDHRQFNQSAEIARALAGFTGMPLVPALRRTRHTETQTHFGRAKRLENLRGAFDLSRTGRHVASRRPPGIVLVDDVLTTGATAHECARTLRHLAKLEMVVVVTVMRG